MNQISNLNNLASQINEIETAIGQGKSAMVEMARKSGLILNKVKNMSVDDRGCTFKVWVSDNCTVNHVQSLKYMKIASNYKILDKVHPSEPLDVMGAVNIINEELKKGKPVIHGWQVLAKGIFLTEATRDSKWVTKNIRPYIEAEIGEFENKIKEKDREAFEAGAIKAYAQWILDKGGVSEAEAEAIALSGELTDAEQSKLDKAIKAWRKVSDIEVQERVTQELQKILPVYNAKFEKYKKVTNAYKGVFSMKEYRQLVSVLHSDKYVDGLDDLQKKKLDTAFNLVQEKKDELCGMQSSGKNEGTLPSTVQDLMKSRR